MFKKAFTLSEALLTMTILGILAAVMLTTLKPGQYRQQAFTTLKKKAYNVIDEATQSILTDCTTGMNLGAIHADCVRTGATHSFTTTDNAIYAKFIRGTTGVCTEIKIKPASTEYTFTKASSLKMRNGICMYIQAGRIGVDVNGDEGPNDTTDRFVIDISNTEGVASDMP